MKLCPILYLIYWSIGHSVTSHAQTLHVEGVLNLNDLHQHSDSEFFDSNSHHPFWSAVPRCIHSLPDSEDVCLYTNRDFANGRGISIITTPPQVMNVLRSLSFVDSNLVSSLGIDGLTDSPFEAAQIEGRGIGLVASRAIKRGEWLMSYTPAIMLAKRAMMNISREDRLSLQRAAFDQLPSPLRDTAYALYGQYRNDANDLIDDIINTNTFSLPLEESGDEDETQEVEYKVLFPEIARFNHACRPTADYYFDSSLLVLHIIAFRDVLPGEEITITYIDPLQKHQARQMALQRSWSFTCNCAICSASSELIRASNTRIDEIMNLQDELVDRSIKSKGSPLLAERLISLLQQEQLWTLLHDGYFAAAVEYNGVGDAVNAVKYAMLAIQSRFLCRGVEVVDDWHRDMLVLSNDPQNHPSWRFRIPE